MNFFTSYWSAILAHVHLFVHPCLGDLLLGHVASQSCMERITSNKQDRSPVAPKQPLSPRVVACLGRGGLWWLLSTTHAHRTTEERTVSHYLSPLWCSTAQLRPQTDLWESLGLLPKLSPCTPPGLGFLQGRYLLLHAREQRQGQAVRWSPVAEHAAWWSPNRQSAITLAKFYSKTTRDLYSHQLHTHGVNGSRALYLQRCTSLSSPCHCYLQKLSRRLANQPARKR